jgi:hypothetical protein
LREQIARGGGIELGPEPRRVALRPEAGDAPAADASRVYLCLEDAEGAGVPGGVWEVCLEGGAVGTIALGGGPAEARRFEFDVTDAVADRRGDRTVVTFHPALPPGFLVEPAPTGRVGRLTLMRA